MNQMIQIANQEIQVKEFNGERVITFKDIDLVHKRPSGTARKRFNDNQQHFIEGEDFYKILKSEKRTLEFEVPNRGLTFITESGYLMLVKSFTDDLAWKVQRQLVNCYFKVKEDLGVYNTLNTHNPSITFEQAIEMAKVIKDTPIPAMSHVFRALRVFVPELEMPMPEPKALKGSKVVRQDQLFQSELQQFLKDNRMSINEFSRKTGIAKSNLWNWVNGKTTPTMSNLQLLADVIDIDINIFFE